MISTGLINLFVSQLMMLGYSVNIHKHKDKMPFTSNAEDKLMK